MDSISSLLIKDPLIIHWLGGLISSVSQANMNYTNTCLGSGSRTSRRTIEFGRTYVVRPKGKHQATIVWLHGLGDNGSSWSQLLESLRLPNIKWICPTAPTRPVALLGGIPSAAWFDVGELSDDGPDDLEGLDSCAAHISNLLSAEPSDVKLGVGGFSLGGATALYMGTCSAMGKFGNGNLYPLNLKAIVGLSTWLPCSRSLRNKIGGSQDAARRAAALPILLCHGLRVVLGESKGYHFTWPNKNGWRIVLFLIIGFPGDDVVPYKYGEKSAQTLTSAGFRYLTFKSFDGLGHYTVPREMEEVCSWLSGRLGLEGPRP